MSRDDMLRLIQDEILDIETYAGAVIEFKNKFGAIHVGIVGYQCYIEFASEADRMQFKLSVE